MGGRTCSSGSILSTACGRASSFRLSPSPTSYGSSLELRWSKNGNLAALGSRLASKQEIFSSLLPSLLMSYVGKQSGQNLLAPCIFIWDCQSSPGRSKRHLKKIWKQYICGMFPVSKMLFSLRSWKRCAERFHQVVQPVRFLCKELPKPWRFICHEITPS